MKISRSLFKFGARAVVLALGGALIAQATVLTLGTKWTILNDTDASVTITCDRMRSDDGVSIKLKPTEVPPHQSLEYNWGDAWYNDGMGLNAGSWACSTESGAAIGTFKSDWGEGVALVVKSTNGRLSLAKGDDKSKMASSDGKPAALQRN